MQVVGQGRLFPSSLDEMPFAYCLVSVLLSTVIATLGEVTGLALILGGRMTSRFGTVSSADPIGPLEVSSANLVDSLEVSSADPVGSLSLSAQQDQASVHLGGLLALESGTP